jgi:integrase
MPMAKKYSFISVLNEYLKKGMVEHGLAPKTQKLYWELSVPLRKYFRGYYLAYYAEFEGRHLNGSTVDRYRQKRLTAKNCRGGYPSPVTIQKELVVASNAVRYQVRDLYNDMPNPFEGRTMLKKDRRAMKQRTVILPEDKESDLLIACVQPLRDIVEFILETGLRKGEVLSLEKSQIKGDLIMFNPEDHKSGNYSASVLSRKALEIIARQPDSFDLVFTHKGNPLTKDWLRHKWEKARKSAGVEYVTIHDLRRTFGYRARKRGASIQAIQKQLRHSDMRTTEKVYAGNDIDIARSLFS